MQTYEGDNTVLVQQLGAFLLKEYSKQFTGNWMKDGVNFLRKQMGSILTHRNPFTTRYSTRKHLKSLSFHLSAFEYRTAKLLHTCAVKFNSHKKKMGSFFSWAGAVPVMVRLTRAYVEQFALQEFAKVLDNIPDKTSSIYRALETCCRVYALSIIVKSSGEFADLFRGSKADKLNNVFEECCIEMKKYSLSLVDAFNIPDFLLDAPIGLSKGHYTENTLHYTRTRNPHNSSAFQLLSKL